jgi:phosphatidylserine/phosphatidylglycerophosphate/cardiolipin synthase-like enzyme
MRRLIAAFFCVLFLGLVTGAQSKPAERSSELVSGKPALPMVLGFIEGAKASLDIMMYHLTDYEALEALRAAAGRGVQVRIILDPSQRRNVKSAQSLSRANLEIRWMDTDGTKGQLMHSKAACSDGRKLLLGSANWTHTGLKVSHETVVLLKQPLVARDFCRAFERDWKRALLKWPERELKDEELGVLPDPGKFYESAPHVQPRKQGE